MCKIIISSIRILVQEALLYGNVRNCMTRKIFWRMRGTSMIELYNGDCRAFLSNYNGERFDAVITDPPYASGGATLSERSASTSQKYTATKTACPFPDFMGDQTASCRLTVLYRYCRAYSGQQMCRACSASIRRRSQRKSCGRYAKSVCRADESSTHLREAVRRWRRRSWKGTIRSAWSCPKKLQRARRSGCLCRSRK